MVSKALRLLEHRATLLREPIALHADALCASLDKCRGKKAVAKHADGATLSVLAEVSRARVETGACGEFITALTRKQLAVLESASTSKDSLFAAKCLAAVAEAFDRAERPLVLRSVIAAASRASDDSADYHFSMATYFVAVGQLILAPDCDLDEPVVRYLRVAPKELLLAYPRLDAKARRLLSRTLSLVLFALSRSQALFHALLDDILELLFFRTISRREADDPEPLARLLHPLTADPEDR